MQPPNLPPPPAGGYPPPAGGYAPPGGFTPPPAGQYQQRAATSTSTEAILALVLSIVGLSTSCFPVGLIAVYFGMKARRQARELGEPNSTNATLGLVGMILGAVFGGLWGLLYLAYIGIMVFAVVAAAMGS